MGSPGGGTRGARRAVAPAAALLVVLSALVATVVGLTDVASAQEQAVDVVVEAGVRGRTAVSGSVPVVVSLTSDRARVVDVGIEAESFRRTYRVELPAGAPAELEVALPSPTFAVTSYRVLASVREPDGRSLGSGDTEVVPDDGLAIVGVGTSLEVPSRATETIAGIQEAFLVPLDDDAFDRPGLLGALSGVVLGPRDIETLSDDQRDALRSWVWHGGNLALDVPQGDRLPVIDLPAAGERTAIGAGWVRFTDGRAAAGPWSDVVEPSVPPTRTVQEMGGPWMDMGFGFEWLGLIDISFLPAWVVVGAVFGTSLVAGPVLWFLLRTRGRRRWMWVASPALSVLIAGGLLVAGQGVFTRADTRAVGAVDVTPWGASGDVVLGLKESGRLDLAAGVDVVDASPDGVVSDVGGGRTVQVDLDRNAFGYLALGSVALDEHPGIEVTAVATGTDEVDVTVTNTSPRTLRSVSVRSAGRVRQFRDVPAGESVTLPFRVGSELDVFQAVFPRQDDFGVGPAFDGAIGNGSIGRLPMTRGVVLVTGSLVAPVSVAGMDSTGPLTVRALAPIRADRPDSAALRIEAVGAHPRDPQAAPADFSDPSEAPTTVAPEPFVPEGGQLVTAHARLSAGAGRAAGPCGVHASVQTVSVWGGSAWVPLERVGERYTSPRMVGASEAQQWALPGIEPGGSLYLRLTTPLSLETPMLFDCVDG